MARYADGSIMGSGVTLRGRRIIGAVDMIGSGLLFSRYTSVQNTPAVCGIPRANALIVTTKRTSNLRSNPH